MIEEKIRRDEQLLTLLNSLLDSKAENITLIYTGESSHIADWTLICEGNGFNHVKAIADGAKRTMREHNSTHVDHTEGQQHNRWILLDYLDIIVHVMLPELRGYYRIEEFLQENDQLTVDEECYRRLAETA
ncbi:MAG: ribosome silencing factor [Fibrobacterota bacterium]